MMLCCFMNFASCSIVSLETTRPVSGVNSCRLIPRKTIRFPLSVMMPSFISNFRSPTRISVCSCMPFAFASWIFTKYKYGSSALQRRGWSIENSKLFCSCAVSVREATRSCWASYTKTRTSPGSSCLFLSWMDNVAFSFSRSMTCLVWMSSICSLFKNDSLTLRKIPKKRQKS